MSGPRSVRIHVRGIISGIWTPKPGQSIEDTQITDAYIQTAIIERYKRRESSVEEALIEMYLARVSVRRVEDITEALPGNTGESGTVSNLNKKVYERIEQWINNPIEGEEYSYVFRWDMAEKMLGGRSEECEGVLVAIGVDQDGCRQVLGVQEGAKEDKESWTRFLRYLKSRGLQGGKTICQRQMFGAGGIAG